MTSSDACGWPAACGPPSPGPNPETPTAGKPLNNCDSLLATVVRETQAGEIRCAVALEPLFRNSKFIVHVLTSGFSL
jgi:hypothetical protein